MIKGEYLHNYGRDSRSSPSEWIEEHLHIRPRSAHSHDADYPVNRSTDTIYYFPSCDVILSLTEYPERNYPSDYMNAASIKGEFIVSADGKREDVAAIEDIIRDIIARQPNAKVESA